MAMTPAAGHPQYSGNYVPYVWSKMWNVKFYDACVIAAIANTDHEGEIKGFGDTVYIRQKPDITIRSYQKGGNLKVQRPNEDYVTLNIDQGKYFNAIEDDVDKIQSDLDLLSAWNEDATEQMKISIDTDVLETVYSDAHASNKGATAGKDGGYNLGSSGSPVTLTKTNILEYLVDCGSVLDEQSCSETKRWFLLIPRFLGLIKKSDIKDASLAGDATSIMRNGRVGTIDRFTIYSSNNVYKNTSDSAYHCMFGHPSGLTFASQMTKMETLRAESTFGTLVRGLQVYGRKVNYSKAIGDLYAA